MWRQLCNLRPREEWGAKSMSLQAGVFNMQQEMRKWVLVCPKLASVTSHGYWIQQTWWGWMPRSGTGEREGLKSLEAWKAIGSGFPVPQELWGPCYHMKQRLFLTVHQHNSTSHAVIWKKNISTSLHLRIWGHSPLSGWMCSLCQMSQAESRDGTGQNPVLSGSWCQSWQSPAQGAGIMSASPPALPAPCSSWAPHRPAGQGT